MHKFFTLPPLPFSREIAPNQTFPLFYWCLQRHSTQHATFTMRSTSCISSRFPEKLYKHTNALQLLSRPTHRCWSTSRTFSAYAHTTRTYSALAPAVDLLYSWIIMLKFINTGWGEGKHSSFFLLINLRPCSGGEKCCCFYFKPLMVHWWKIHIHISLPPSPSQLFITVLALWKCVGQVWMETSANGHLGGERKGRKTWTEEGKMERKKSNKMKNWGESKVKAKRQNRGHVTFTTLNSTQLSASLRRHDCVVIVVILKHIHVCDCNSVLCVRDRDRQTESSSF